MPNHCSNRVSFYGDSESEIQKLHDIFSKGLENDDNVDTGSVFGHFIPEPDWANIPYLKRISMNTHSQVLEVK